MEKYANKKLQKENSRNYNAFKRDRRSLAKAITVVFMDDFNFCPF